MKLIFTNTTSIRRRAKIFLAVSLVLVCLFAALPISAASAVGATEVTLTVRQNFITDVSGGASRTFTYQLTPLETTNPMPAGSNAEGFTFTATGTGEVQVGPITFTSVGIYSYELSVISSTARGYTYDTRVYRIDVYILNDTPNNLSASNLTAVVIVYEGRDAIEDNKVNEILFEHRYQGDVEIPPQTSPPVDTPQPPPGGGGTPITGDFSNIWLWISLVTVSGGMLLGLLLWIKQLDKNKEAKETSVKIE